MPCIARRVLIVVSLIAVPTGTAIATTARAAAPVSSHVAAPATDPAAPLAKPGDSSPTVKRAQKALIRIGLLALGSADGFFGSTTESALNVFQQQRGLSVNGTLDVPTATALRVIKAPTILSKGARGEAVRVIQQRLLAVGISIKGGADGVFGRATVAALKTFQRSKGLRPTGKLDAGTAAVLANAAAGAVPPPVKVSPPVKASPPVKVPSPAMPPPVKVSPPVTPAPPTTAAPVAPTPAPAPLPANSAVSVECAGVANAHRAAAGLAALTVNAKLNSAAEGHSAYQASITTMTHAGAGGVSAGSRITNAGYTWRAWGENVAFGQADCASVVAAWMASDGHRANILSPMFTEIGIAVATGSNGYKYWTMDLGAPA